jgi:hypothetical protein
MDYLSLLFMDGVKLNHWGWVAHAFPFERLFPFTIAALV